MGKEGKRRAMRREAEVEKAGSRTEGCRVGKDSSEVSESRSMVQDRQEGEEKDMERAIEEMLNECQRNVQEEAGRSYNPGGSSRRQKRPLDEPGWGREDGGPSQFEGWSKQSTGMDRGQRRFSAGGVSDRSTGEGNVPSQFAWQPTSRLALNPCREEEALTELDGHMSWQETLMSACAKKESLWGDLGPALSKSLEVLSKTTRCGQSTEGIFPLPLPGRLGWCEDEDPLLDGLVRGLNSLFGV